MLTCWSVYWRGSWRLSWPMPNGCLGTRSRCGAGFVTFFIGSFILALTAALAGLIAGAVRLVHRSPGATYRHSFGYAANFVANYDILRLPLQQDRKNKIVTSRHNCIFLALA